MHLICFGRFAPSMSTPLPEEQLERGLGLTEAVALNMNAMVGIGPFIVIPLVIQAMGGPQCLLAWVAGAVLSLLDGLVWAELGAAMPRAGGTYAFLREAYGPGRGGRLMSFLYIWQTLIQAPLVVASGAIGFSQYLTYLVPLGKYQQKAVSAALVVALDRPALPQDFRGRPDLEISLGRRGGHDAVDDLGRGDAFLGEDGV